MDACLIVAAVALCFPGDVDFAYSDHFFVSAPTQDTAEKTLSAAERFRKEFVEKWQVGNEVPNSVGGIRIDWSRSRGLPASSLTVVKVPYLRPYRISVSAVDQSNGELLLRHRIADVVLQTKFGDKLGAWVRCGTLLPYADPITVSTLQRTIAWYPFTENWPDVRTCLSAKRIGPYDLEKQAVAWSLTQYLQSRGGERKFLEFAIAGRADGWNTSLRQFYGIQDVKSLEKQWQAWVIRTTQPPIRFGREVIQLAERNNGL